MSLIISEIADMGGGIVWIRFNKAMPVSFVNVSNLFISSGTTGGTFGSTASQIDSFTIAGTGFPNPCVNGTWMADNSPGDYVIDPAGPAGMLSNTQGTVVTLSNIGPSGFGIYNAVYRKLAADTLVSSLVGTAIFNGFGIITAKPQIQIAVDEEEDGNLDAGPSTESTVDIKIVAGNPSDRSLISRAVKFAINRRNWTDQTVAISSVLLTAQRSYEQSVEGDVENLYYVADQTYNFLAQEV